MMRTTRIFNIIKKAESKGFTYDIGCVLIDIETDAEDYLIQHCKEPLFVRCDLKKSGNHQFFTFGDNTVSGDIFDFGHYNAKEKVYFKTTPDGYVPVNWFDIPMVGEERKDYIFVFATQVDDMGHVCRLFDYFE